MTEVMRATRACFAYASILALSGCGSPATESECEAGLCPTTRCEDADPLRKPLFGDTHVHTSLSFDANVRGTRLGPEAAYRFARGESIGIPPYDGEGNALRRLQRPRPLDWVAVTDHAEMLGAVFQCRNSEAPAYSDPACEAFRTDPNATSVLGVNLAALPSSAQYPGLCGEEAELCLDAGLDVWASYLEATEAANDASPACEFTTLPGYEWTGAPGLRNLHRNVIFGGSEPPAQAVGYFDAPYVEELWQRLRDDCIDTDADCDALTIPHNSNLSAGLMFERWSQDELPMDAPYASERAYMEPLIEIYQHKGDSECLPGETISDEFCGFEKIPGDRLGYADDLFVKPEPSGFVRAALADGLRLGEELGANPFKYGFVASTDTHITAPGHVSERRFAGHGDIAAGATEFAFAEALVDYPFNSPGGLAAVWAEENSRESVFRALRRRETFGTSGPRIVVRFFGGWSYAESACDDPEFARIGYAEGVPMGGDLSRPPSTATTPTFLLSANQEPGTSDAPGTPLQRTQIVKGWLTRSGTVEVRTYDVGGDPDNGATVQSPTCETDPGRGGFSSLCSLWVDPSFDPERPAFYYARVLENPVCRWSTRACQAAAIDCSAPETITSPDFEFCCDLTTEQCEAADVDCSTGVSAQYESCCRPRLPKVIQERAWTSPIWYSPSPRNAQNEKPMRQTP